MKLSHHITNPITKWDCRGTKYIAAITTLVCLGQDNLLKVISLHFSDFWVFLLLYSLPPQGSPVITAIYPIAGGRVDVFTPSSREFPPKVNVTNLDEFELGWLISLFELLTITLRNYWEIIIKTARKVFKLFFINISEKIYLKT